MKLLCIGIFVMTCEIQQTPQTTTVVCPPVVEWRADLQKRAAAEIRTLPKGSATAELVARAVEQRNVNRRCIESRKR